MSNPETAIWEVFKHESPSDLGNNPSFSDYDEEVITWDERRDTESPVTGAKQLDGVVETDDIIWVCEVKQILGYEGLGQAITYATVYELAKDPDKEVVPCVIYAGLEPRSVGVIDTCKKYGVGHYEIENISSKLSDLGL